MRTDSGFASAAVCAKLIVGLIGQIHTFNRQLQFVVSFVRHGGIDVERLVAAFDVVVVLARHAGQEATNVRARHTCAEANVIAIQGSVV